MTEIKTRKDHTNAILLAIFLGIGALITFGIVFEMMKFIAVVKYVFS